MKNLPFVVVAVLVWTFLPDDFALGGLVTDVLILIGGLVLLTPFLVHSAIRRSLPERVEFQAVSEQDLGPEMQAQVRKFEAQDFVRAGLPLCGRLGNPVVIVPLLHSGRTLMGAVYGVGGRTQKVFFDVVSLLDREGAALTTGMEAGGGVLPSEHGSFKQIFPGASVETLIHNHGLAQSWLQARDLVPAPVVPEDIPRLLRKSVHVARRVFMRHQVRNTFVALWRTLSKRNPHLGPLPEQPGAENTAFAVAAAPRPRPLPEPALSRSRPA